MFERLLQIQEAAFGRVHPNVALTLTNLGAVLGDLGDWVAARDVLKRALSIYDETLTARYVLSRPQSEVRDIEYAGAFLKRAFFGKRGYGPEHERMAVALANLGYVLRNLGDLHEARAACERAVLISEQGFGADHPNVAEKLNILSGVLMGLGDLPGARTAWERTLSIFRKSLGDEHPKTKIAVENLRLLEKKLELDDPRPDLQRTHETRVMEWQRQFEDLNKKVGEPGVTPATEEERKPVRAAAAAAVERLTKEKDWWAWQLKADAEPDPMKQEAIYREGLKDFPQSAVLMGNFAIFMKNVRKDYDEAERLYRKALELDPNHANNTGNFAVFMDDVRKDYDEAERLYRKAAALDLKDEHWKKQLTKLSKEHPEFDK
jgi:tetratricopeptide (TPR) repeat protein